MPGRHTASLHVRQACSEAPTTAVTKIVQKCCTQLLSFDLVLVNNRRNLTHNCSCWKSLQVLQVFVYFCSQEEEVTQHVCLFGGGGGSHKSLATLEAKENSPPPVSMPSTIEEHILLARCPSAAQPHRPPLCVTQLPGPQWAVLGAWGQSTALWVLSQPCVSQRALGSTREGFTSLPHGPTHAEQGSHGVTF